MAFTKFLRQGANTVSTVRDEFIKTHGPLLTIAQLAKILSRSEEGLRISLRTKTSEFSRQLYAAKKQYGRRIYFSVEKIADILEIS